MYISDALTEPMLSMIETQHNINIETLNLINKYTDNNSLANQYREINDIDENDDNNVKPITYTYRQPNSNIVNQITVPVLSLVQIPSISINKMNIKMSLEKVNSDNQRQFQSSSPLHRQRIKSEEIVKITRYSAPWKTYDVELEVQSRDTPIGLNKLNNILSDFIQIKQSNDAPK